MSQFWRKHAKPVSKAELEIQAALGKEMLFPLTQHPFCLQQTKPDFYFPGVNLAIYIDGQQVHQKREAKDEELRRLLEKRHGCIVRSYSYKAPLTKKRLREIVEHIIDDYEGLRKMKR
jgi:hypothetical protein